MIIYIARHGETMWNALGKIQGNTNIELNEKGISYAKKTGESLKDVLFTKVISSPLNRAYDTAAYILEGQNTKNVPIETDDRIREICFGKAEGTAVKDGAYAEEFYRFFHDTENYQAPEGGETIAEILERTKEFWEELISQESLKDDIILLSSHGCAVRALLQNVYRDGDFWHGSVPPNCSVNIVEVIDGKARLLEEDKVYWGSAGPLPY